MCQDSFSVAAVNIAGSSAASVSISVTPYSGIAAEVSEFSALKEENGVRISAAVTNNLSSNMTSIIGIYSQDSTLLGIKQVQIASGSTDIDETISYDGEAATAKLFVWDSMIGMVPFEQSMEADVAEAATEVPAVPENLTAVPGDKQITLTWDAVSGATSYSIYWWDAVMNEDLISVDAAEYTDAGKVTYTITGLTNKRQYTISVASVNSAGTSSYSGSVDMNPATLPDAPTGISAEAVDSGATLKWEWVIDTTGYSIKWTDSDGVSGEITLTKEEAAKYLNITTVTYPLAGLTNGKTYSISIASINLVGTGEYSDAVTVTPVAED